jgi:DNA-binding MarR family transcriptional regulator
MPRSPPHCRGGAAPLPRRAPRGSGVDAQPAGGVPFACERPAVNEEADEVIRWLRVLARYLRRRTQACHGPGELPAVAWLLLHAIGAHPGQTVSGLARHTGLSKSRVSVVIDRLQALELVEKRPDPRDQRLVRLYGTGRRTEGWEAAHAAQVQAVAELLVGVPAAERQALLAALRQMGEAAERRQREEGDRAEPLPAVPGRPAE